MSNDLKSDVNRKKRSKTDSPSKLSLYPLSFEKALGAALQTGGPPKLDKKKIAKAKSPGQSKPRKVSK